MRLNGNPKKKKTSIKELKPLKQYPRVSFPDAEMEALGECALRRCNIGFGKTKNQLAGVLGEAAAMRVLGLPIQPCEENDGGIDFLFGNIEIDAKYTNVENGGLLFNEESKFVADVAILTRPAEGLPNAVDIIGWTTREQFLSVDRMRGIGGGKERLIMPADELNPIETLVDFQNEDFCRRYNPEEPSSQVAF